MLQRFLTQFTVGQKLSAIGAIGLFTACVVGLLGHQGMMSILGHVERMERMNQALAHQTEVGRLRDAVRSDVLYLFVFMDRDRSDQGRKQLGGDLRALQGNLSALHALPLGEAAEKALAGTTQPLHRFVRQAETIGGNANYSTGGVSLEDFEAFEATHEALGAALGELNRTLNTEAADVKARGTLAINDILLRIAVVMGLGLVGGYLLIRLVARHTLRAVHALEQSMDALSRGDLTVLVNDCQVTTVNGNGANGHAKPVARPHAS